jgi:hypothetical protein
VSFYRATERTARKQYRCMSCNTIIKPGDRYLNCAGISYDGDFWCAAQHPDCREWEIEMNEKNNWVDTGWMSLDEWVSDGGPVVLDGAPSAVRVRFGLTP